MLTLIHIISCFIISVKADQFFYLHENVPNDAYKGRSSQHTSGDYDKVILRENSILEDKSFVPPVSWSDLKTTAMTPNEVKKLEVMTKVNSYAEITRGDVDGTRYILEAFIVYNRTGDLAKALARAGELIYEDTKKYGLLRDHGDPTFDRDAFKIVASSGMGLLPSGKIAKGAKVLWGVTTGLSDLDKLYESRDEKNREKSIYLTNQAFGRLGVPVIQFALESSDPNFGEIVDIIFKNKYGVSIEDSPDIFFKKAPLTRSYFSLYYKFYIKDKQNGDRLSTLEGFVKNANEKEQAALKDQSAESQNAKSKIEKENEKQKTLDKIQKYRDAATLFSGVGNLAEAMSCGIECKNISIGARLGEATSSLIATSIAFSKSGENSQLDKNQQVSQTVMAAATLNYVALAMNIINSGKESQAQTLMKQLQQIQEQLQKLINIVTYNFEKAHIDNRFFFTMLNDRFDLVEEVSTLQRINDAEIREEAEIRNANILLKESLKVRLKEIENCHAKVIAGSESILQCWQKNIIGSHFKLYDNYLPQGISPYLLHKISPLPIYVPLKRQEASYYLPTLYRLMAVRDKQLEKSVFDLREWLNNVDIAFEFLSEHKTISPINVHDDLQTVAKTGLEIQKWLRQLLGDYKDVDNLGELGSAIDSYKRNIADLKVYFNNLFRQHHISPKDFKAPVDTMLKAASEIQLPPMIPICEETKKYNISRGFVEQRFKKPVNLEKRIHPEILSRFALQGGELDVCYHPHVTGRDGFFGRVVSADTGLIGEFDPITYGGFYITLVVRYKPVGEKKFNWVFSETKLVSSNFGEGTRDPDFPAGRMAETKKTWDKLFETKGKPIFKDNDVSKLVDVFSRERQKNERALIKNLANFVNSKKNQNHLLLQTLDQSNFVIRSSIYLSVPSRYFQSLGLQKSLDALFSSQDFLGYNSAIFALFAEDSKVVEAIYSDLNQLEEKLKQFKTETSSYGPDELDYSLWQLKQMNSKVKANNK